MAFWNPFDAAALVRTTVGTRRDAEAMARRLVDARLAACVHVTECASVYRWEGRVRQETEFIVEARTTTRRRDELAQAMLRGHPYDTPFVECLQASLLLPARYVQWMRGEVNA